MCGRFTQHYTWREIHDLYGLVGAVAMSSRDTTSHRHPALTSCYPPGPALVPMRWGLIPSWWKKTAKDVPSTFNARAETVADKPMFRSAFKHNRCIIPASGYFEWKKMPDGKQPYFISAADGGVPNIAGLWDGWPVPTRAALHHDRDGRERLSRRRFRAECWATRSLAPRIVAARRVLRDLVRDGTRDRAVARRRIAITRPKAHPMDVAPVGRGNHSVQAPFKLPTGAISFHRRYIDWLERTRL
jgi:SOS response associated peptidase (SRAP)